MIYRRLVPVVGLLVWAGVVLTAAPLAPSHRHAVNAAYRNDAPISSCSDLHVRFDNRDVAMQTEERTITKSEAPTLRVQAETNGGIQVQGWEQNTYAVTLCKVAEAGSDADLTLSKIHLTFQNGELGVSGPSSRYRWAAHLLIRAPKAAVLDLRVNNGPMGLYNVDGDLKIRAENGPITVTDCTGELDLSAQNGPITLKGNSGKQNVHAEDGPVTLSLAGNSWTGDGIEAHATNGPVILQIPPGYKSGVLLEADGHGPFQCRASVCAEGRKSWGDDRKSIEFGAGPTLIRVSTVNGPISVR